MDLGFTGLATKNEDFSTEIGNKAEFFRAAAALRTTIPSSLTLLPW